MQSNASYLAALIMGDPTLLREGAQLVVTKGALPSSSHSTRVPKRRGAANGPR